MKIGFFTDTYLPQLDGVSTSVETCVRALEERGHEVNIIAPKYPRYRDKKKNVVRLTSIKFMKDLEMYVALQIPDRTLLKVLRMDFDIIHGHSGGPITLLGWQVARVRNIAYVATYHTLWNRYTHYFFKGKIIKPKMVEITSRVFGNVCDCLIAPTERVKKELISYGIKKPIRTLLSGIDVKRFTHIKKGFLRKKIKLPKKTKILLYVGRLGKEKSVDFIIRSFKIIHEKESGTALVLVGCGPEQDHLEELVKELNITDSVCFLGVIKHSNIPKVYADADIFVFASQTETQGIVILEAMASGLPVVAVKDMALEEMIINNQNGFLVRKNPNYFAEKALFLLNDKKLHKNFSLQAQKNVHNFTADKTAEYLENLYITLIHEKSLKSGKIHHRCANLHHIKSLFVKARDQFRNYNE